MSPYTILALLIAWALSLAGVGAWQNETGHVAERSTWQTRDNEALRLANAKIKVMEEGARQVERDHAVALDAVATNYEKRIGDAKTQYSRDLAAMRSGALRLRDPSTPSLSSVQCGQPGIAAGAGGRDGGQGSGLSDAAAEFLLSLASDADAVVEQLTACQAVIRSDRTEKPP